MNKCKYEDISLDQLGRHFLIRVVLHCQLQSTITYCCGGIIGTIYAALNNDNLKSLVLMAVPIDSSKDNTVFARWLKALDVDKVIDDFGSIDGLLLELAFIMRNPPRYAFDRYAMVL